MQKNPGLQHDEDSAQYCTAMFQHINSPTMEGVAAADELCRQHCEVVWSSEHRRAIANQHRALLLSRVSTISLAIQSNPISEAALGMFRILRRKTNGLRAVMMLFISLYESYLLMYLGLKPKREIN